MFVITTQIARPIPEVFARLTRIEDAPLWYSAVEAVQRRDSGPVRLGSRAQFTRRLGNTTVENEVEVSEFEPDRTFTLSSVTGPTPFVYRYRLAPFGRETLLGLEGEISGEGLYFGWFKPLAEVFFKRGMAANMNTLKGLVERAPR
jgi:uncharacterized protein YndB with AHSA1/START domain